MNLLPFGSHGVNVVDQNFWPLASQYLDNPSSETDASLAYPETKLPPHPAMFVTETCVHS